MSAFDLVLVMCIQCSDSVYYKNIPNGLGRSCYISKYFLMPLKTLKWFVSLRLIVDDVYRMESFGLLQNSYEAAKLIDDIDI